MPEFSENLWAPWRMEYIRSLGEGESKNGCFLCRYWEQPDHDPENHVLWRTASTFVIMNRFPYTNGHLLVAHANHKGDVSDLSEAEFTDMTRAIRQAAEVLRKTLAPHGFNIGFNIGQCAGAGLPEHLHAHIVPRWSGDTNFMAVIGDSRIIPDSLDALWAELVKNARATGPRK